MSYTLYVIMEIGLLALTVVAIGYAWREATCDKPEGGGDETS